MTRTPPPFRAAEHLLGLENVGEPHGGRVAVRVCERLRRLLTKILGSNGYLTLLRRALTLAKAQSPALSVVEVKADGTLEHADDLDRSGEVALVSHMLDLLVTFVGAAVTLRILQDAWPDAVIESLDLERRP